MITNTLHSVSHILVAEPPTHLLHIDDYRYMSQTQRYSNAMYIPGDVQTGQIDLISVRSRCMHKHPSAHHAIHCMLRAHARYDGNTIAQRVWCICGIENDWLETELVAINEAVFTDITIWIWYLRMCVLVHTLYVTPMGAVSISVHESGLFAISVI